MFRILSILREGCLRPGRINKERQWEMTTDEALKWADETRRGTSINDEEAMDTLAAEVRKLTREPAEARAEIARLRGALVDVVNRLGNGSAVAPDASVDYLEQIPHEVAMVIARKDAQIASLTEANDMMHVSLLAYTGRYPEDGPQPLPETAVKREREAIDLGPIMRILNGLYSQVLGTEHGDKLTNEMRRAAIANLYEVERRLNHE
jgi:flagellar motor switch/type III secretory pathway protein FliN